MLIKFETTIAEQVGVCYINTSKIQTVKPSLCNPNMTRIFFNFPNDYIDVHEPVEEVVRRINNAIEQY